MNIAIQEAYWLLARGRFEEALEILSSLTAPEDLPQDALETADLDLALARLLLTRSDEASRERARSTLGRLAGEAGPSAWRAELERARLAREEGDLVTAAAALKSALDGFRRSAASGATGGAGIAGVLAREVALIQASSLETDAASSSLGREIGRSNSAASAGVGDVEREELLRLVELGRSLASENDPDRLLGVVLQAAMEMTGAERSFLVLVHGEELEFSLAQNADLSEVSEPSFEVSRTLIRKVIEDRKPLVMRLSEVPADHPASRSLGEIGTRSVACLPILLPALGGAEAGAPYGVLYLDGRDPAHRFTRSMERLLDLFASQAGAALENARIHRARALELEAARETILRHRTESERRERYEMLIGASDAMNRVYQKLDLIARTEMPVVIEGETGTGKELAARLVHSRGPRSGREFVATNCAGLAETLLEDELFGHERGAFTGAERSRPGLFELAHRGTLFLDEVGDMSPRMQADLLRALQSGEVRRLGGRETIHVDVRVIAATHRDLSEMVQLGEFREDLYFRLNVFSIVLPPLRERAEDVPLLATEILRRHTAPGTHAPTISAAAMRRLIGYPWPGNVRELENVLRRLTVIDTPVIEEEDLPPEVMEARSPGRPGTMRRAEVEAVRRAVEAAGGNKAEAARILGVDRKTVYAKLKQIESGSSGRRRSPWTTGPGGR